MLRTMVSESNDRDEIVRFRLYVAGYAPNLGNLRVFCEACPKGRYEIETVDILRDDVAGLEDGIVATPTPLKVAPAPHQPVVGTLTDWNALAELRGIDRKGATWNQVWSPSPAL